VGVEKTTHQYLQGLGWVGWTYPPPPPPSRLSPASAPKSGSPHPPRHPGSVEGEEVARRACGGYHGSPSPFRLCRRLGGAVELLAVERVRLGGLRELRDVERLRLVVPVAGAKRFWLYPACKRTVPKPNGDPPNALSSCSPRVSSVISAGSTRRAGFEIE